MEAQADRVAEDVWGLDVLSFAQVMVKVTVQQILGHLRNPCRAPRPEVHTTGHRNPEGCWLGSLGSAAGRWKSGQLLDQGQLMKECLLSTLRLCPARFYGSGTGISQHGECCGVGAEETNSVPWVNCSGTAFQCIENAMKWHLSRLSRLFSIKTSCEYSPLEAEYPHKPLRGKSLDFAGTAGTAGTGFLKRDSECGEMLSRYLSRYSHRAGHPGHIILPLPITRPTDHPETDRQNNRPTN